MGNVESASFPYTIKDQLHTFSSAIGWTLHNGIENATGQIVSIFCFDKLKNASKIECARNGMILLRQLRHPFILRYLNGIEQTNHIYIVSEPVTTFSLPYRPLSDHSTPGNIAGNKTYGGVNESGSSTTPHSHKQANSYHSNDSSSPTMTQSNVFTSTSLELHLKPLETNSPESIQLLISAGLFQIYTALDFLNISASIVHGMINPGSIFISQNGDWKLGNFDLAFKSTQSTHTTPQPADTAAFIIPGSAPATSTSPYNGNNSTNGGIPKHLLIGPIPVSYRNFYSSQVKEYLAPDIMSNQWKKLEHMPLHVIDSFSLAQLLRLLINPLPSSSSSSSTTTPTTLSHSSSSTTIPPLLLNEYRQYFPNTSPQNNETVPLSQLPLYAAILNSTYFNNHIIAALTFLDSIHVKTVEEKTAFFTQFSTIYTMFPTLILRKRIIPQLLQSFDVITPKTAGASFGGILNATFAVSKVCLPTEEYTTLVVPLIQRLFQSADFDIRLSLLQSINEFAHLLTVDLVFNDILPTLVPGMFDVNPIIRELTVNAFASFFPLFVKAKTGEYDSSYKNIAIMSNKVAHDAYALASTTLSSLATYMGYNIPGTGVPAQSSFSQAINPNSFTPATAAPSTTNSNSISSSSSLSSTPIGQSGTTPSQIQSISSSQIPTSATQSTHHYYALPSQYLSQIIFPTLINQFPSELVPSIRSAIILTSTSLAPLLSITQQETLLLTIYAKGMKDHAMTVRCTALDGLIISLLTSGFTVHTICNKIIPFVAPFVLEKEQEIFSRAIFILQYTFYKIQYQYHKQQLSIDHIVNNITTNYPNLQLDLGEISKQLALLPQSSQYQPSGVPAQVSSSGSGIGGPSSSFNSQHNKPSSQSNITATDTGLLMLQQTTQTNNNSRKKAQNNPTITASSIDDTFSALASQPSPSLPSQSQPSSPLSSSPQPVVSDIGNNNQNDAYWSTFHSPSSPISQPAADHVSCDAPITTNSRKVVQKCTTIDFDDTELDAIQYTGGSNRNKATPTNGLKMVTRPHQSQQPQLLQQPQQPQQPQQSHQSQQSQQSFDFFDSTFNHTSSSQVQQQATRNPSTNATNTTDEWSTLF